MGEQAIPVGTAGPWPQAKMLVDALYDPAGGPTFFTPADVPSQILAGRLSLQSLAAPVRAPPSAIVGTPAYQPPANVIGRTAVIDMALELAEFGWTCIPTVGGITARGIESLQDPADPTWGTAAAYSFDYILWEVSAIKALADAAGKTYGVIAVLFNHGEANWFTPDYTTQVEVLRLALDTKIKAITGQSFDVRLIMVPQSSLPFSDDPYHPAYSNLTADELITTDPDHYTGFPMYQFPYHTDGIHMREQGYRREGELAAVVFRDHYLGNTSALRAITASRAGAVITVNLDVPTAPLQWSTTFSPHPGTPEWENGQGFEVTTAAGVKATITSVVIEGSTVQITCSADPGTGAVVSYALYQDGSGYNAGTPDGRLGNLCDSAARTWRSARSIVCNVTNGSSTLTAATAGDFVDRALFELVSGSGLAGTVHVQTLTGDNATLSAAWGGSSGTASLTFQADPRNYLIPFKRTVA